MQPPSTMKTSSARLLPPENHVRDNPSPTDRKAAAAYDSRLVERYKGGDDSAFTEIMRRYYHRVVAVARQVLRNADEAEEVAQDTFIRAHRGLANFRGEAALSTWLYCIALNLARNHYWYFFRRQRQNTFPLEHVVSADGGLPLTETLPASTPNPRRETINSEFVALVRSCMEQLDAPHREILTLRNMLHLSYEEIADALEINVGTVKSRLARAREGLRRLILQAAPEFDEDSEMEDFLEPLQRMPHLNTVVP
jgi:RNA polymerase sigma-70 factor (ECF subfamily)